MDNIVTWCIKWVILNKTSGHSVIENKRWNGKPLVVSKFSNNKCVIFCIKCINLGKLQIIFERPLNQNMESYAAENKKIKLNAIQFQRV